ncbi:hypothetical protein ACH5RR_030419 [Cinchona calisaya]|uniref:Uncharacterized protein n=1 Tax=Cinchona calisaya TaxID=153742 RepID=A0ABD2YUL5_9GENT
MNHDDYWDFWERIRRLPGSPFSAMALGKCKWTSFLKLFSDEVAKDAKGNVDDVAGKVGSMVRSWWSLFQQPSTRHTIGSRTRRKSFTSGTALLHSRDIAGLGFRPLSRLVEHGSSFERKGVARAMGRSDGGVGAVDCRLKSQISKLLLISVVAARELSKQMSS